MSRILKSELRQIGMTAEQFVQAVAVFLAEKKQHDAHMERVEADKKKEPVPEPSWSDFKGDGEGYIHAVETWRKSQMELHQPYPAPIPHALIARALESGKPEFEIYNDDAEIIAATEKAKKQELLSYVGNEEAKLYDHIAPFGKLRLFNLRAEEIHQLIAKHEATDDNLKFLEEHEQRLERIAAVRKWAAELMAEIEDLTIDTLADWKFKPFDSEIIP